MELDLEKVMILLHRKWNSIREIERLTQELDETFGRNHGISAVMLLQLRADEMEKVEHCMEEIWQLGEGSREAYDKLHELIESDLGQAVGKTPEERKIFEIRRKTQKLLDELKVADQRLNQKMAGKKSFYKK